MEANANQPTPGAENLTNLLQGSSRQFTPNISTEKRRPTTNGVEHPPLQPPAASFQYFQQPPDACNQQPAPAHGYVNTDIYCQTNTPLYNTHQQPSYSQPTYAAAMDYSNTGRQSPCTTNGTSAFNQPCYAQPVNYSSSCSTQAIPTTTEPNCEAGFHSRMPNLSHVARMKAPVLTLPPLDTLNNPGSGVIEPNSDDSLPSIGDLSPPQQGVYKLGEDIF